jgi:hypothetical protein
VDTGLGWGSKKTVCWGNEETVGRGSEETVGWGNEETVGWGNEDSETVGRGSEETVGRGSEETVDRGSEETVGRDSEQGTADRAVTQSTLSTGTRVEPLCSNTHGYAAPAGGPGCSWTPDPSRASDPPARRVRSE